MSFIFSCKLRSGEVNQLTFGCKLRSGEVNRFMFGCKLRSGEWNGFIFCFKTSGELMGWVARKGEEERW